MLGQTGEFNSADAIDILLEHPSTAAYVGGKLFNELVGWWPDEAESNRIGTAFRRNYSVIELVAAIVAEAAFLSDAAIGARVRSPLEKVVGLAQAFGIGDRTQRRVEHALHTLGYVPFMPPNVAGYPEGNRLLDPHRLIHTFDLVSLIPEDVPDLSTSKLMARLGLFDISEPTRNVLDSVPPGGGRLALAINSPEFHIV